MDIEWAKDGNTGELFIVQARPETVQSQKAQNILRSYHLSGALDPAPPDRSCGEAISQGKAHLILDVHNRQFSSWGSLSDEKPIRTGNRL